MPAGVARNSGSTDIYVTDQSANNIRKVQLSTAIVSLIGGSHSGGGGSSDLGLGQFLSPYGAAVDLQGNVFVADRNNHKIRRISPAGVVTTIAGTGAAGTLDGTGTAATFNNPTGLAIDAAGNLYVADQTGNKIRKIYLQ
jgi:DNA-binding beta-propeller fold protein YncE